MNRISVNGLSFVDDFGRERIFNGINFVYKGIEKDPDGIIRYHTDITGPLLAALVKKGINIIRLGLTWAGVEPEPEKYNTEYLDGFKKTLKLCEEYGVYCLVDWHQDLFSPFGIDSGDGAPAWACSGKNKPRKPRFIWSEGYFFDSAVHKSFDAFWENKEFFGRGLRDRFCDMLAFTADYIKDCGAVIGYDVFNEPFPGASGGKIFRTLISAGVKTLLFSKSVDRKKLIKDLKNRDVMEILTVLDNPRTFYSVIDSAAEPVREFDTERYYPFIKAAAGALRKVDGSGIIFYENCFYSNIGLPCSTPLIVNSDGAAEKNIAFAPHAYDFTVDSPLTNCASPVRVDYFFGEHERTQKRLGCPVLVGEWGGMVPGAEEYPALEHLLDKFDKNKWSHTYWHYCKNLENEKIMKILSRPLPVAVAGRINSYGYDRKKRVFTLSYTGDGAVKAPTVVYLPEKPVNIYSTKKYSLNENGMLLAESGGGECEIKAEF